MSKVLHTKFCNIPKHKHYTHDFPFDLRCESDNYITMYTFTICRCVSYRIKVFSRAVVFAWHMESTGQIGSQIKDRLANYKYCIITTMVYPGLT